MDYDPNQDLEYVLKTSEYIRSKCTSSRSYSENLYRALCDVVWISKHPFAILKRDSWNCSWRYAAEIVGDLASTTEEMSDHLDWYSVGGEGIVSKELLEDLDKLGFMPVSFGKTSS